MIFPQIFLTEKKQAKKAKLEPPSERDILKEKIVRRLNPCVEF